MKKMKQKILMMLVATMALTSLIGCENKDNNKEQEKYEAFLNGECGLYVSESYTDDMQYMTTYFESEEAYYLKDILEYESEEVDGDLGVKYAYIDCGNDGKEELLLQISKNVMGEEFVANYVIKYMDGQLELCYGIDAWSRRSVEINEYGYVREGGSGGAGYHAGKEIMIDCDGECNTVCEWQTASYSEWSLEAEYFTVSELEEIKQEWLEENNYSVELLEGLEISMFVIDGVDYYTYYISEGYEDAEEFIEKCEDAGVYFSSQEEVNSAIEDKIESLDAEGLANGADIEFLSL